MVKLDVYVDDISALVGTVGDLGKKAIPGVLNGILCDILPRVMHDVRSYTSLSGHQKKKLVTDTLVHAVQAVFKVLNETSPTFRESTLDEDVEAILIYTLPNMIDLLVRVDNGDMHFRQPRFCVGC